MKKKTFVAAVSLACLAALLITPAAQASINLEWRPLAQTVSVGDPVGVGLYAVSDSGVSQDFSSTQVIIEWDPGFLELTGNDDTGGIGWLGSSFMPGDSFGINEADPPADGNGMWMGTLMGEVPVFPEGTLLTTITFNALLETTGTPVGMLSELTIPTYPTGRTKMLDFEGSVLGTLGEDAMVTIIPEPSTAILFGLVMVGLIRRRP